MSAKSKPVPQMIVNGLVGLASAAGIAPGAAIASDCKLSVLAAPQVLYSGQSARVNVFAHFPSPPDPDAPYAFAFAAFDVLGGDALWSFATDGAIVGSDILGIEVGQQHMPPLDIYANPSNPYRVWGGILKASDEPALVEVEVDPGVFSVYPSKLTSSSIECEAEGGSDLIFMNPLSVGSWLAAPGQGTSISVADDVVIDGKIITGENPATPILIGMLHPAIQKVRASSARVAFDGDPETFTATVQLMGAGDDVFQWDPGDGDDAVRPDARRTQIGSMTMTFDGLETGGHVAGANFAMFDGSVQFVAFEGFLGGVSVTTGDLDAGGPNEIPGLVIDSLPQTIGHSTGALINASGANTWAGSTLGFDQPIVATVRDSKGFPQIVTLDRIEVYAIGDTTAEPSNFAERAILGSHVFEAVGVKEMWITPSQGN